MVNFKLIVALSTMVLATHQTALAQTNNTKKPNIIYVLADDLGYADINAMDDKGKIATPNLDALAAAGMRFTDAHTSSAVCTPTRYGILTGRYNWRSTLKSGVLTGISKALILPSTPTVGSILQQQNYTTAFIGKWHLGWDWAVKPNATVHGEGWDAGDFDWIDFTKPITNGPKNHGFTYSYGHAGSLDMGPYVYVENGLVTAQPNRIEESKDKYGWYRRGPTAPDFVHQDVTPHFFDKAKNFVQQQAANSTPYFLYLALPAPHSPILPALAWQGKSGINPYADFVMMVDNLMGQLIETVNQSSQANNTIIIFTSDNGCSPASKINELELAGHHPNGIYRGHKADIYEGGHRVPFIVKWPAVIKAGTTNTQTICTTDFMATAAEITGHKLLPNQAVDSYSMLPLFKDKINKKQRRPATIHHSINGSFAIRQGNWKLILCGGSGGWTYPKPTDKAALDSLPPIQLYNLLTNPNETENVQATNPKIVANLKALLIKYIEDGRSTPGPKQQNDPITNPWKQIDFTKQ